jgi:hypothetical protein
MTDTGEYRPSLEGDTSFIEKVVDSRDEAHSRFFAVGH